MEDISWTRPGAPTGTRLGSIRPGEEQVSGDLVLRPGPCLTAVRRHVRVRPVIKGADQWWSVDDVGWALAGAWLTEPDRISRSHTTAWPVVADHPAEQVWRLPLAAFHPLQFFPSQERGSGLPPR